MRSFWRIGIVAALLWQTLANFAADVITNVMSPVVSYQFQEDFGSAGVQSPVVSYQYFNALSEPGTFLISPIVSYQYFEWPGDDVVQLLTSPRVSYFFQPRTAPDDVTIAGLVTSPTGEGISGATISATVGKIAAAAATSDALGRYSLPALGPGVYVLNAGKSSFLSDRRVVSLAIETSRQNFSVYPLGAAPAMGFVNSTPPFVIPAADDLEGSSLRVFDGTTFITDLSSIDANKMTIVITHGWISSHGGWPQGMATAMAQRGVLQFANIVAWDWEQAAKKLSDEKTPRQGTALGKKLYERLGGSYHQHLHMIGHSLGTLVQRYAADFLNAPGRWDPNEMHLTIFDEAEAVQVLTRTVQFIPILNNLVDEENPLAWKNPIPSRLPLWIDNYVSEYGIYHPEAVNLALQKAGAFPWHPISPHSYPQAWYSESITRLANLNDSTALGFRRSFEHNLLTARIPITFPPTEFIVGEAYHQKPDSMNEWEIERLPNQNGFQVLFPFLGNGADIVIDHSLRGAEYVVDRLSAAGRKVGNVTISVAEWSAISVYNGVNFVADRVAAGGQEVMDLLNRETLHIELQTGLVGPVPIDGKKGKGVIERDGDTTSPRVWLPILVPADAALMEFDFAIRGAPVDDMIVCGIADTNLFSLEAKYIPTNSISTSRLIEISNWSGQQVELFFGFMGGTSANAVLQIENIRFYSLETPRLEFALTETALTLSWPTTANGYIVETATALAKPPDWQPATNTPSISGSRYTISSDLDTESRFFRLRSQ